MPGRSDVFRHGLGFLDVSADDAGIGAEMDERADLSAADCAGTTCAEDCAIGWTGLSVGKWWNESRRKDWKEDGDEEEPTEDAIFPYVTNILALR